jgi:hypothetical protein
VVVFFVVPITVLTIAILWYRGRHRQLPTA